MEEQLTREEMRDHYEYLRSACRIQVGWFNAYVLVLSILGAVISELRGISGSVQFAVPALLTLLNLGLSLESITHALNGKQPPLTVNRIITALNAASVVALVLLLMKVAFNG